MQIGPASSSSFAPLASGLRAAADARLTRDVLTQGGAVTPDLNRALKGVEAQGQTVVAAAVLKMANDQLGQVLDLLA